MHENSQRKSMALILSLMLFSTALPTQAAEFAKRPFRGAIPISVLLCNFSDAGEPIRTREQYQDFIVNRGTGGLADYWYDTSFGSIVLDGSSVHGWYALNTTTSEGIANSKDKRTRNFTGCVERVDRFFNPPDNHMVVVITNPAVDGFGSPGSAFQGENTNVTTLAHEVAHGMRLNHSFSDTTDPSIKGADWELLGEYDNPWDLMSAARVKAMMTESFSWGGPGLNAYHRDRMGWISSDKILRFGADGETEKTVTLTSLNRPGGRGYQMVRIPFTSSDLYSYFTVEYRINDGWDSGFATDRVLIHLVTLKHFRKPTGESKRGYFSFLFRQTTGDRDPVQSINRDGVKISVVSTDAANGRATVRIEAEAVARCVEGMVWREAAIGDRVCVTKERRRQIVDENARHAERVAPGPYVQGNVRCRPGFVWRESIPVDQVCVTPESRDTVRSEAVNASARTIGAAAYGPNTCKQGYVWRNADARDWVCVTRQRSDEVRIENESAASRRQPGGGVHGPSTCRSGFVWRDAFPGDHVCVTRDSREKAQEDNEKASDRLANAEA